MNLAGKRKWVLLALLAAALLAAAMVNRDEQGSADTVAEVRAKPKAESTRKADAGGGTELALLQRPAGVVEEPANAFQSKSWYVPPPPPPPVVAPPPPPPPAPVAPPLPFTYLGQYQDKDKPVIFLVRGDRVLTVSAGDIIEGTYRVEGIVGTSLGLTYLPLNIKQTLNIGTAG